jgi:hypothetical protein
MPPPIRRRFSRSLGHCLKNPDLTEERLRAVVDTTNELLPARLDAIVERVRAGGTEAWHVHDVVTEVESECCTRLPDELRLAVEAEVQKVVAAGAPSDSLRRRIDRIVKAAKLSSCYGSEWATAWSEASEMDGTHVFQGGALFETGDYFEEDDAGKVLWDDDADTFIYVRRFCPDDVRAWRHFLQLGGWNKGDDVHQLFRLFKNYQQKHTVVIPWPGVLKVEVLHPFGIDCRFEDPEVDHAAIAAPDAPTKVWWCRVWTDKTGLKPDKATFYPLLGELVQQRFGWPPRGPPP